MNFLRQERETLEKVIQARNAAVNAHGVAEQAQAENALTGTLKTLFAVAEAYPDLKANENFKGLQEELTATENRNCPAAVGVPDRVPSVASLNPSGSVPEASVKVNLPIPPVARKTATYAVPTMPAGIDVVSI